MGKPSLLTEYIHCYISQESAFLPNIKELSLVSKSTKVPDPLLVEVLIIILFISILS